VVSGDPHSPASHRRREFFVATIYQEILGVQSMPKVKVRIAVAVDPSGKWNACGWRKDNGDTAGEDAMDCTVDMVGSGEARYWVEAELDVPEVSVVSANNVEKES